MTEEQTSKEARGTRHIEVFAEASSIEHWRKQVIAGQPDAGRFAFISDEGDYLPGGEGTAPTPLTYFVAGVALWLISQMSQAATRKKLILLDERVKVTGHFLEQGSVLRGTKEGSCQGFDIEISVESDEPEEEIAELIRLAHRMCFTEATLSSQVQLTIQHRLNGQTMD